MHPHLKEFYAQDASIRKLPKDEQQRLFKIWAKQRNITEELHFKSPKWFMPAKRIAIVSGCIYFVLVLQDYTGFALITLPIYLVFMFCALIVQNQRPYLKP